MALIQKLLKKTEYGTNFPDITRGVDEIHINRDKVTDSITDVQSSSTIAVIPVDNLVRSLPFTYHPHFLAYSPISSHLVIVKKSSPKNLSADCRSTVGRLSAVCRPTVGRLLADCRPSVGRLSAVCWPTVGRQTADRFSPKHRLSVGRQSADKRPTVGRQLVMCR